MLFSARDADFSAEANAANDGFVATGCEVAVVDVPFVVGGCVTLLSPPLTTAFSGGTATAVGLICSVDEEFLSGLVIVEAFGTEGLDVEGTDVRFSATKKQESRQKIVRQVFV